MLNKRYILAVCLLLSILVTNAQDNASLRSNNTAKIELISSDIETSIVKLSFANFNTKNIQTPTGLAKQLSLKGAVPVLFAGAPEILSISTSIIIPDNAEMDIKVIAESFTDYQNINIAPSKGNLTRDINPSSIP